MSQHALPEEDRVRPAPGGARHWFALLGASVAWATHFMVCYLLIEAACAAGWQGRTLLGLNGVAAAVLLTTLLTLPVAIASALVARRVPRRGGEAADDDAQETDAYLGRAGLLLGALFSLVIVAESIPALVLAPCAAM
jgi:membrane protein implicated in regulation of membrane protease activity